MTAPRMLLQTCLVVCLGAHLGCAPDEEGGDPGRPGRKDLSPVTETCGVGLYESIAAFPGDIGLTLRVTIHPVFPLSPRGEYSEVEILNTEGQRVAEWSMSTIESFIVVGPSRNCVCRIEYEHLFPLGEIAYGHVNGTAICFDLDRRSERWRISFPASVPAAPDGLRGRRRASIQRDHSGRPLLSICEPNRQTAYVLDLNDGTILHEHRSR